MRREREREIGAMGARKESDDGRDEEFKIERLSVGPAESNSVELGAWRPACVRDVVGQAANFSVISDRGLESHSRFTLSQSGSHVRGLVGACGVCVCVAIIANNPTQHEKQRAACSSDVRVGFAQTKVNNIFDVQIIHDLSLSTPVNNIHSCDS